MSLYKYRIYVRVILSFVFFLFFSGGNTGTDFSIDGTTGVISIAGSLDFEDTTSYTLTISATDRLGGSGANTAEASVIISINPLNEDPPTFASATYSPDVDEDLGLGSVVVTVAATDNDDGEDGDIFYSMSSHTKFYLNSETGDLILTSYLDYETDSSYTLTVTSSDRGSTPQTDTTTVTVSVNDVNDNTPQCTPTAVSVTLREDDPVDTILNILSCTDQDSGTNAALTYTITSVNGNAGGGDFAVNGSGVVSVASALDYETDSSHELVVTVEDGGSVSLSTSVIIGVAVTDVNEYDPSYAGTPTSMNFAESAVVGDTLLTVTVSDQDTEETVTYYLSPTSTNFHIDPYTGEIFVKSPLDREVTDTYTLTILAQDSGTVDAIRTSTHNLTVIITDDKDSYPVYDPAVYFATVSENDAAGVTVTAITATDDDDSDTLQYTITAGNSGNIFGVNKINPAQTAEIVIASIANLDYETYTSVELTVEVEDSASFTDTALVIIEITAYNEHTPTFIPSTTYTESLSEDFTVGDTFIQINATDDDAGQDGDITYTITSGSLGKFAINSNTGYIRVVADLDRETTQEYTIEIVAADNGGTPSALSATATLTVSILDINDNSPVCSPFIYVEEIDEDTADGTSLTTIACSDADLDPNGLNDDFTYSITVGDDLGDFEIDANTGEVSVAVSASLDYETTPAYSLIITATDKGTPPRYGNASLFINLAGLFLT